MNGIDWAKVASDLAKMAPREEAPPVSQGAGLGANFYHLDEANGRVDSFLQEVGDGGQSTLEAEFAVFLVDGVSSHILVQDLRLSCFMAPERRFLGNVLVLYNTRLETRMSVSRATSPASTDLIGLLGDATRLAGMEVLLHPRATRSVRVSVVLQSLGVTVISQDLKVTEQLDFQIGLISPGS